jgi:hypothetical protein
MTTTTKLNWRLKTLPSVEELRDLVKDGVVTKEEAREILFSVEPVEEVDKRKALEEEVLFLRSLVEKLSARIATRIVEVIRDVERRWQPYPFFKPYEVWCASNSSGGSLTTNATYSNASVVGNGTITIEPKKSFSDIKTF